MLSYFQGLIAKLRYSHRIKIARFLTSSGHFSVEKNLVKPNAFMPMLNLQESVLETSIFKINNLNDDDIWKLATDNIVGKTGRTLHGRAELEEQAVLGIGLDVKVDDRPPRHGTIRGWPEKKSERKLLAIKLASASKLCIAPTPQNALSEQ